MRIGTYEDNTYKLLFNYNNTYYVIILPIDR